MSQINDKQIIIETAKSKLYVINDFIKNTEYYYELCNNLELKSNLKIHIFNKECIMHRDIGFYSNESIGYKYSGQISKSIRMDDWMIDLINKINIKLNTDFNGILINKYKNGSDYIGAHSDDEKNLSKNSLVACISLGEERIFRIKNKINKEKIDIITKSGQLLIMEGDFQKEFTHEIPIQKRKKNCRISLTFRKHLE
jgi:alkylated DNA repair dioxygenase AlkB